MSDAFELEAKVRTDQGKGASRRLRRLSNEIPAIIYGGDKDPLSITLSHDDISHAVENEAFFSHIITIKVGKNSEQVIIKALQRHPAKPFILHADFLRILADEEITVNVPVHFLNEDKCKGVKLEGGIISRILTEIEITCLPKNLPEFLEVDMLEVGVGENIHLTDVTFPEGVTSVSLSHGGDDADLVVASVQAAKGSAEEEETAEPEGGEAPPAGEAEEQPDED
jgi:large subunit ribosomal protein L25